jgi:HK97 family phage prohead protease
MLATEHRQFAATTIRGVSTENRTVEIIASDFSLDSYGTRIDPNGWDIEQFKRNPVICLQHDSYDDLPVAHAIPETVRVEGGKLMMTVQFPPQGTSDDSDKAFNLIAAGVLRGVSVGFDPSESEQIQEDDGSGMKMNVVIFRKQRLMEVSFVTIPSNDNGLVVRARELNQEPKKLRALVKEMEIQLKAHQEEVEAQEKLSAYKASYALTAVGYMERKQPANRAATKALEKFYKRILDEEPPTDEVQAWDRMSEAIEAMEKQADVEIDETVDQPTAEETTPAPEAETTPILEAPAAPEPARTASVQISLAELFAYPERLTKAFTEAAVAALRQGISPQDVGSLVDGLNQAVSLSVSNLNNGQPEDRGGIAG